MGQSTSSSNSSPEHIIPDTVGVIQDEVFRHARILTEIATLTYEDFQKCLASLNALSRKATDHNGKQLLFAVKKGTDSTVLWKGTVRIACVKLDPETKVIDSYRLVNLSQFMRIFRTFELQFTAAKQSSENEMTRKKSEEDDSESDDSEDSSYHEAVSLNSSSSDSDIDIPSSSQGAKNMKFKECKRLTASILLEEVDNIFSSKDGEKLGECCICLENKPDVMLPCAHAYCLPCIEQWNTVQKTCPICRDTLDSTNDTWVISDIPGSHEIDEEICSTLMKLTTSPD